MAISEMNNKSICGREVRTNWATSRKLPPPTVIDPHKVAQASSFSNTTVYVGGITKDVHTQQVLQASFSRFGTVEEVRTFETFGFVKMQTHQAATTAICEMNGASISGCTVKCRWGKDDHKFSNDGNHGQYGHTQITKKQIKMAVKIHPIQLRSGSFQQLKCQDFGRKIRQQHTRLICQTAIQPQSDIMQYSIISITQARIQLARLLVDTVFHRIICPRTRFITNSSWPITLTLTKVSHTQLLHPSIWDTISQFTLTLILKLKLFKTQTAIATVNETAAPRQRSQRNLEKLPQRRFRK
jgi:hypothetical protein